MEDVIITDDEDDEEEVRQVHILSSFTLLDFLGQFSCSTFHDALEYNVSYG